MIDGARTPLTVDLGGYRVAISAGANGIGKRDGRQLRRLRRQVFVSDVDHAALAACGHPGMRADAGDPATARRSSMPPSKHLGGLDVLVNNAGIAGPTALVEHVTPEELDATLRIDLATMFHCRGGRSRRCGPRRRCDHQSCSAAGRFGFPLRAPYAAAKWGVIGFTKSLSIELAATACGSTRSCPGRSTGRASAP